MDPLLVAVPCEPTALASTAVDAKASMEILGGKKAQKRPRTKREAAEHLLTRMNLRSRKNNTVNVEHGIGDRSVQHESPSVSKPDADCNVKASEEKVATMDFLKEDFEMTKKMVEDDSTGSESSPELKDPLVDHVIQGITVDDATDAITDVNQGDKVAKNNEIQGDNLRNFPLTEQSNEPLKIPNEAGLAGQPEVVKRLRRRSIFALPSMGQSKNIGRVDRKELHDKGVLSAAEAAARGSNADPLDLPAAQRSDKEAKGDEAATTAKPRPSLSNINQNTYNEAMEKDETDRFPGAVSKEPVRVDVGADASNPITEHVPGTRPRNRRRLTISSPEVAGRVLRKRKATTPEEPAGSTEIDVLPSTSDVVDFEFTGSSAALNHHMYPVYVNPETDMEKESGRNSVPRGILKKQENPHKHRRLAFIDESAEDREKLAENRRMEVEASVDQAPIPHLLPLCPSTLATAHSQETKQKVPNFRILSWNIAGLSAFLQKNTWREINAYLPDVICLQETKVQSSELLDSLGVDVGTSFAYWHQSVIKGHAGVALLSKNKPLSVLYGFPRSSGRTFAEKGHVITAEYDKVFVVNAYVPNSSMKLKNLAERLAWDIDFRAFLAKLQKRKPVMIAGDLNCARLDIDLTYPAKNRKNPGFTDQERNSLAVTLEELELIDVYRSVYPEEKGAYTFWSNRSNARNKNVGWRLDYFLLSSALNDSVCGIKHFTTIGGSDHCPIMLYLNFP